MTSSYERAEQKRIELEKALQRKPSGFVRFTRFLLSGILVVGLSVWSIPSVMAFSADAAKSLSSKTKEVTGPLPQETADYQKTEVVYALLSATGEPEAMYVVNRFDVVEEGSIVDFGAYDAVSNLTDDSRIQRNEDAVIVSADEGAFFYQGDVVGERAFSDTVHLPWKVNLSYQLDGRDVAPADLAGASGDLSIKVATTQNEAADPAFFDSYMLQITFTLDGDTCTDVQAEGATMALSGRNRTVAFTALPGKEGDFALATTVRDFEMAGVQIAALPYSMVMEMPDTSEMEDGMTQLSDAISQLNSGTASLASGADRLASGAKEFASGTSAFGDGLEQLCGSSADLVNASAAINDALSQIAGGLEGVDLSSLSAISWLTNYLRDLANGIDGGADHDYVGGLVTGLKELSEGLAATRYGFDSYIALLPEGTEISSDQIANLIDKTMTPDDAVEGGFVATEETETAQKLAEYYAAAALVRASYFGSDGHMGVQELLEGSDKIVSILSSDVETQGSLAYFAAALRTMATSLDELLNFDQLDQLGTLFEGLKQLAGSYAQFDEGLRQFAAGLSELNDNYAGIEDGASGLASGAGQFADGAWELSSGVGELNANTINLPAEMRARIDEMMADYEFPEFDPRSFVSEKNQHVAAVQFVFTTEPIKIPEPEAQPEPDTVEPTLWDRFLDLFR